MRIEKPVAAAAWVCFAAVVEPRRATALRMSSRLFLHHLVGEHGAVF